MDKRRTIATYFEDITQDRYDALTAAQERDLFAGWETMGERKRDKIRAQLVEHNLQFAISIAKQYQKTAVDLEDLIQYANLGLIRASTRFDPTKGYRFISYAVWWIRQAILESIARETQIVRLPANVADDMATTQKIAALYYQEHEVYPDAEYLQQQIGKTPAAIEKAIFASANGHTLSLDIDEGEYDPGSHIAPLKDVANDTVWPDVTTEKNIMAERVQKAIAQLPERERDIIAHYFSFGNNEPLNLQELGKKWGITRERVRQIKENVFRYLSHPKRLGKFKDDLSPA